MATIEFIEPAVLEELISIGNVNIVNYYGEGIGESIGGEITEEPELSRSHADLNLQLTQSRRNVA